MRDSATAIREWILLWPPAPIPGLALAHSDHVLGLEWRNGLSDCTDDEWLTYWLIVAEAMEGRHERL